MPQIFNKIGREKVREILLEEGLALIRQHGLKKTSVSDIAKAAGIATGTFYNFFSSKEEFVHQIVLHKRGVYQTLFDKLFAPGKGDKEALRQYLRAVYLSDDNIFDYLSPDEMAMLNARWPTEYWVNEDSDESSTKGILARLEGVSPACDWRVFANLSKSISLIRYGRKRLYQDVYEDMLDIYIHAILDYVFAP